MLLLLFKHLSILIISDCTEISIDIAKNKKNTHIFRIYPIYRKETAGSITPPA